MGLSYVTAGESHGPGLAVLTWGEQAPPMSPPRVALETLDARRGAKLPASAVD
jgi:hypothetical protein